MQNVTKYSDDEIFEIDDDIKKLFDIKLPVMDELTAYKNRKNRLYFLEGIIDDDDLSLVDLIRECNTEDIGKPVEERRPIIILINSDGGSVTAGWNIIKAIEISKTPVYTVCYNRAYSMAAEILAIGHKRFAMPGSSALIHRGSCSIGGEQSVVESTQNFYKKLEGRMLDYLFEHTKIDPKKYKKKASADIYYLSDEMLQDGLVDEVISDLDTIFVK